MRAGVSHRYNIQNALIALLETPVPNSDSVGRAVLTSILGPKPNFYKPIIGIASESNHHRSSLVRPGVKPVVWGASRRLRRLLTPDRTISWTS